MGILLAFAPFVAFAIVDRLIGPTQGLIAGAATSVVLLLRDWIGLHRKPKILEIGTAILFGGLALYAILGDPIWSIVSVRLRVDAGLLLIVLTTLIVGKPFTLQYAREQVPQSLWDTPQFIRSNYVITGVWSGAFLILVLADLILIYRTDLPPKIGILATVLALVGAFKFTQWYPRKDTDGLRTLLARDRAVEDWLRETVAPAYDALQADPSRAVSAEHVRSALSNAHKNALAKKR